MVILYLLPTSFAPQQSTLCGATDGVEWLQCMYLGEQLVQREHCNQGASASHLSSEHVGPQVEEPPYPIQV